MPVEFRRTSRLIGYWAWELDRVPENWNVDMGFVDEIWVPSDFVAGAVAAELDPAAGKLVRVVPHAVDALPLGPRKTMTDVAMTRAQHALPAHAFVVGFSFAMSSNYARKNPMAAVAAFQAAFPRGDAREARLILRCNDLEVWPPGFRELSAAAAADPRILLVDSKTRRLPIIDLYRACDVYLSLHRSEGYGLNLAEAAEIGTVVIATGWALAADIAARPQVQTVGWRLVPVEDPQRAYTGRSAQWAEPDIAEAAEKLRSLEQIVRGRERPDA
jgi:hypothetical protein